MEEVVRIVEEEGVKYTNPIVIEGLPDVGLVGTIAASYIVEKLDFKEIGHIESDLFPPVMVIHNGNLKDPFRIYSAEDGSVVVVLSEVAVPPKAVYPLTTALAEWFSTITVKDQVISIKGLPVKNRMDIENPEVFGIGNNEGAVAELKAKQMDLLEEGFIAGTYAMLLRECWKKKISAISLLAQCYPVYPDPGAAASAIETVKKFVPSLAVDVSELLENAEEIKLKARDLMQQTALSASEMQKDMEQDMPIMYQ
ncbi:MAG: proteasome assembly chaperone family protein [Methanomicrobia archaeon]|nr:proteasome assembly chaperone family protein [Methanomicrobia archaeon]